MKPWGPVPYCCKSILGHSLEHLNDRPILTYIRFQMPIFLTIYPTSRMNKVLVCLELSPVRHSQRALLIQPIQNGLSIQYEDSLSQEAFWEALQSSCNCIASPLAAGSKESSPGRRILNICQMTRRRNTAVSVGGS
jgi:hypothetical protein